MGIFYILWYILISFIIIVIIHKGIEYCKNIFTDSKIQDLNYVSKKYEEMYENLDELNTNHLASEINEIGVTPLNKNINRNYYNDIPVQLPPPNFEKTNIDINHPHPPSSPPFINNINTDNTPISLPVIYNDRLQPISSSKDKPIILNEMDEYDVGLGYEHIKERLGQYEKPTVTENKMRANPHQLLETIVPTSTSTSTSTNPFEILQSENHSNKMNKPEQIQFNIPHNIPHKKN